MQRFDLYESLRNTYGYEPERLELYKEETSSSEVNFWLDLSEGAKNQLQQEFNDEPISQTIVDGEVVETLHPEPLEPARCIATYNHKIRTLTIFPVETRFIDFSYFPDQYKQIKSIKVEDISYRFVQAQSSLEGLVKKGPRCLSPNYYKGLGFKKDYYSIIEMIEAQTNCTKIVVTKKNLSQMKMPFTLPKLNSMNFHEK